MIAHIGSPVDARDTTTGAATITAAAAAVGSLSTTNTSGDFKHGLDPLPDSFRFEVLLMIKANGTLYDGVFINLRDNIVFVDKQHKKLFYETYDALSRQNIFSERISVPAHLSLHLFESEMESLKQKHNMSGYVFLKESSEVALVSTSSRQLDSFVAHVKDLIQTSGLSCQLPNGRVLKLLKRNIVAEDVDIIVNAANDQLEHAGGVAAAINNASHNVVQQYCRQFMKKRHNRSLKVGNTAVTDAGGSLKCRKIIHAVGPEQRFHRDCQSILIKLVHAILNEGEALGLSSIALPAISTGIFGVSKDLVAQCFLSAIPNHRFSKPVPVMQDIRIVIIDQPTYDCFHGHFQKMLLSGPVSRPLDKSKSKGVPMNKRSNDRTTPPPSYAATVRTNESKKDNGRENLDHDSSRRDRRVSPGKPDGKKDGKHHGHGPRAGSEREKERRSVGANEASDPKSCPPENCGNNSRDSNTNDSIDLSKHDDSKFSHSSGKESSDAHSPLGEVVKSEDDNDGTFYDAVGGSGPSSTIPSEGNNPVNLSTKSTVVTKSEIPDMSPEEPTPSELSTTGYQTSSVGGTSDDTVSGSTEHATGSSVPNIPNPPPGLSPMSNSLSSNSTNLPPSSPTTSAIATTATTSFPGLPRSTITGNLMSLGPAPSSPHLPGNKGLCTNSQ